MAARGRPMISGSPGERPRFKDHQTTDLPMPDLNPYVREHHEYGLPVMPAATAATFFGRWHEAFGREAPLVMEIGTGNGFFITELARRNPDWNVLGIEIRYKRVMQTGYKIRNAGLTNAIIARYDAWFLDDILADGCLAGLWVNHPDPWPKRSHDKHRLLGRPFMEEVARVVEPGGFLNVKSDTRYNVERVETFIDRTLHGEPLPPLPLEVVGRSEDVITGEAPWPDDIETNYQSKFRKKGEPVYAIALRRMNAAPPGTR